MSSTASDNAAARPSRIGWAFAGAALLGAIVVTAIAGVQLGSVGAAVVFLGIAAAVLGSVLWLLFRSARVLVRGDVRDVEDEVATGRRKKELEREKLVLLKAIKELEFDHEMGKVSDRDFNEIAGQYRARAVRVLRQLDEAGGDYRSMVEREVARAVRDSGGGDGSGSGSGNGNENGNESANASRNEKTVKRTCGACSVENDADAEFCKKCGNSVHA